MSETKRELALIRLWMRFSVTVLLIGAGVGIVCLSDGDAALVGTGAGLIGLSSGYWLR